ncbi:MAG: hypothetical protein AAB721_02850 [Patescibacteria group bacterium]
MLNGRHSSPQNGWLVSEAQTQYAPTLTQHDPPFNLPFEDAPFIPVQPMVPVRTPPRATALLCAACAFVPVVAGPPPFDPSTGAAWVQQDVAVRARPRATALRLDAQSKPPPQFIGSVRNPDTDLNTGLRITTNLPASTVNYTVKCFFYLAAAPDAGDHVIWAFDDGADWHSLYVTSAGDLVFGSPGATVTLISGTAIRRWYVLISAVANGSANFYWKQVADPGAMSTTSIGTVTNHTPTSFSILDSLLFSEPFNGRMAGTTLWQGRVLTSGEAALEATKLGPYHTGNVSHHWPLASAATRNLEVAYGRSFTDFGAGSWSTEEGPLLVDGPLNPALNLSWAQPRTEGFRRKRTQQPEALAFVPLVAAAPAFTFWQPTFPDQLARIRRFAESRNETVFAVNRWGLDGWWRPTFPDSAPRRAPLHTPSGPAYVPAVNRWGLDGWWRPEFPERVRARPAPLAEGFTAYVPAVSRWGLDGWWRPTFPDGASGQRRALQAAEFRPVDFGAAPVVPPLAWLSTFPELLPRARHRPESSIGYVPAVSRWGLDAPAFLEQPVDVFRPRRTFDIGGFSWVPIVAAPVPFSWFEQAVDPVRRAPHPLLVGGSSLVQLVTPVVVPPFAGVQLVELFRPRVAIARLVDGLFEPLAPNLPVLPYSFGGRSAARAQLAGPSGASVVPTPSSAESSSSATGITVSPAGPSEVKKP